MDLVSLLFVIVDSYPHIMTFEPGRSFGKSSRSHMWGLPRLLNDPKACEPIPERAITLVVSADEETLQKSAKKSLATERVPKMTPIGKQRHLRTGP